jgi:hypothetical protein
MQHPGTVDKIELVSLSWESCTAIITLPSYLWLSSRNWFGRSHTSQYKPERGVSKWLLMFLQIINMKWVFDDKVVRRAFGPNGEKLTGWRKWHNEELYNVYSSWNIVPVIS